MKRITPSQQKVRSGSRHGGLGNVVSGEKVDVNFALESWAQRSMSATPRVQAKLEIGTANDPFEREADAFATAATKSSSGIGRTPTTDVSSPSTTQSTPNPHQQFEKDEVATEEHGVLRPKLQYSGGTNGGTEAPPNLPDDIGNLRGKGSELPADLRGHFENLLGGNLSSVRIHTGAESISLNHQIEAKAFTVGQDIFFGQGQYNPSSPMGQELIAHEVAHTVQQGSEVVVRRVPWEREAVTSVPASCFPENSIHAIEQENRYKLLYFSDWMRLQYPKLAGKSQTESTNAILEVINLLDLSDSFIRAEIGTILADHISDTYLLADLALEIQNLAWDQQEWKRNSMLTGSRGMRSPILGPMAYVASDLACSAGDGVVRVVKLPLHFIDGMLDGMKGTVTNDHLAKIADKLTDWDALALFPIAFSSGFSVGLVETFAKMVEELIDFVSDPGKMIKEIFDLVTSLVGEGGEELAKNLGSELGKSIGKEIGEYSNEGSFTIIFQIGRKLAPLLGAIIIMILGKTPPANLLTNKAKKLAAWIKSLKKRLLIRKQRRVNGETDWPLVNHRAKKKGVARIDDELQWNGLEKSGILDGDRLRPGLLENEISIVKDTEMIKLDPVASGFIGEVRLPNGRTWRKHEDGSWTRFPENKRFVETENGWVHQVLRSRFVDHAITTLDELLLSSNAQRPVGKFLKSEEQAREVLQRLAQNDHHAWKILDIDLKGQRFDSDKLEWGLARDPNTKEYFVIRGNDPTSLTPGAVDWKNYVNNTEILAHSHPYFDHAGVPRSLKIEQGAGKLDEVLKDSSNQTNLLPSPEDLKFMVDHRQSKHIVSTPYRYDPKTKQLVNPNIHSNLPNLELEIGQPSLLGKSDIFECDVFEVKVRPMASGKFVDGEPITMYMLDTKVGPQYTLKAHEATYYRGPVLDSSPPFSMMDDLNSHESTTSIQALPTTKVNRIFNRLKSEVNEAGKLKIDWVLREAKEKGDILHAKEFDYVIDPKVQGVRRSGPDAIGKAQGLENPQRLKIKDLRGADDFTLAAVMHAQAKSHGGGMNIGNLFLGENTTNVAHGYWENIALALARAKRKVRIHGVAIANQDHSGRFFQYNIEVDGKKILNGWIDPTKVINGLKVPGPNTFNSVARKLFEN